MKKKLIKLIIDNLIKQHINCNDATDMITYICECRENDSDVNHKSYREHIL